MNNAQLDLGVRVNGLDRFRQALETIHAGDEAVFHPTGFQIVEHAEPELGALRLTQPHTQKEGFVVEHRHDHYRTLALVNESFIDSLDAVRELEAHLLYGKILATTNNFLAEFVVSFAWRNIPIIPGTSMSLFEDNLYYFLVLRISPQIFFNKIKTVIAPPHMFFNDHQWHSKHAPGNRFFIVAFV